MIGLAPHTGKIIDAVAQLDCIRPYWLVGGTALSLQYSRHRLKSKNLLSMLTRGELFAQDANFHLLEPVYNISAQDIENYIRACLGTNS